MNVSLHQLKVFIAVARERSFTRAAHEFDLTQSAVSRCVRELEEALDLKLFDRTTRQVELTTAGASLERRIARLLDEIDLTLHEERVTHDAHTGVVELDPERRCALCRGVPGSDRVRTGSIAGGGFDER
jgi:DNA-binding transcriptional LysR family regulator